MNTQPAAINIPESILTARNSDAEGFAGEICLLTAIKLYELGHFSSGRAAELAGIHPIEFLIALDC